MNSVAVKRSRMDDRTFLNAWNSDKSLEEIAAEYNVKVQTLRVRRTSFEKQLSESLQVLDNQLTVEQSKSNPDSNVIKQLQSQISRLSSIKLRGRKAARKTKLDNLLSLVG